MKLIVKQGIAGRGVFAWEPITRGTQIIAFTGPLLRYKDTTPKTLALQIGQDLYLGASGHADDYINHSCKPNCGLQIAGLDVRLIALRDIATDEEICFDYSTTMNEDDFEMPCKCGSSVCRGIVGDFKHLPAELRRQYAKLGIVPEYNLKFVPSE
jgi:SET domain-containing protein